jgi:hypothetical protein
MSFAVTRVSATGIRLAEEEEEEVGIGTANYSGSTSALKALNCEGRNCVSFRVLVQQ